MGEETAIYEAAYGSDRDREYDYETAGSWLRADEIESFLRQTNQWKNAKNEIILLKDIDQRYARNILWFLERKAPELLDLAGEAIFWAEAMTDTITGRADSFQAQDSYQWMVSRPLYKAIARIAYP